jgi:hypothetical protein
MEYRSQLSALVAGYWLPVARLAASPRPSRQVGIDAPVEGEFADC